MIDMDTATLSLALLLTFVLLLFFVVTIVALNEGMFTRNSDKSLPAETDFRILLR